MPRRPKFLVCVWSSPRSTPRCTFYSRLWHRQAGSLFSRSGYLSGFRRHHENSCLKDGRQLFRLIASDQKYSTLSKQTSATVTGHVINSVKARLQQCQTSGGPCISDRSTPVNTPRCSAFDDWLTQVRPRLFIAPWPSLVVSPRVPCIDWPYLFFAAITTLRLSTWRGTYTGLQTTTPGDAWDRQQHTNWWYLGQGSAPSAIVRLELPALVCGTIYHLQSSLHHRWPCSRRIWRLTFSSSLTVNDINAFQCLRYCCTVSLKLWLTSR